MSGTATIDWRKDPPAGAFEMTQDGGLELTIIAATDNYNRDRAALARAMECEYVEVRVETYWMVWDAVDAEARWRQDHCECEDGPHYPGPLVKSSNGEPVPPEECATTKPAQGLYDFWDEDGWYCPWSRCERTTPGAVKFRRAVP